MESLSRKVFSEYPDIEQVIDVYHEMKKQTVSDVTDGDDITGDEKYRPLLLLLAVLYKVQERNDEFFKTGGTSIQFEETKNLMEVVGYFWHQQHHLGKMLREGINTAKTQDDIEKLVERNKSKMIESLKLEVVHVSVSEMYSNEERSLQNHTPDFVIHLDRPHGAVIFTILGTRIFPRPNAKDIIMDCAARCQPFLDGHAHGGMVHGHNNLVRTAMPLLLQHLQDNPGFSLLVVGYSLGAALAQLFMMDLSHGQLKDQLPANVKTRAILYGCPPVYKGSLPCLDNVLMISNHNDGVTGVSFKNLHNVMLKTQAIHKLNIQRRTLLKMALNISNDELEEEALSNVLKDDADGFMSPVRTPSTGLMKKTRKTMSIRLTGAGATQDVWDKVMEAAETGARSHHDQLSLVGKTLVVIKKAKQKGDQLRISEFMGSEDIGQFSRQIRFKYGMMDHHMPWSYNSLFAG